MKNLEAIQGQMVTKRMGRLKVKEGEKHENKQV